MGDMHARDSSLRRRGPGLSGVTRASDTEPPVPGAEQFEDSAEQEDEDASAGFDNREDVEGLDDVDVLTVENDGEEASNEEDRSDGNVSVTVKAPATWHADWDAWLAYLLLYCKRTMQVLPVKETMSRAERNKRLLKTKKGETSSQLVPEGFDPYQRTYICTHGWKKRKSRSEGSRPRQHIRLTDCPFRFVVQWNMAKGDFAGETRMVCS